MHSLACPTAPAPAPAPDAPRRSDLTDLEAVGAIVAGDREMFEVIVRRYNTRLYRVGMAYLRNHAQVEDAMQEAYLKAFLHLPRFRGTSAFATWLTRIMINECLMILRGKRRFVMESLHEDGAHAGHAAFVAPAAADPLHGQDIKALLERAVQTLPRTQRAVYLMRDVQQLSTAETARCLGLTRANVKVSLHRARESLKAALLKTAAGIELFDYPARCCDPMTARVMQAVRAAPAPLAT